MAAAVARPHAPQRRRRGRRPRAPAPARGRRTSSTIPPAGSRPRSSTGSAPPSNPPAPPADPPGPGRRNPVPARDRTGQRHDRHRSLPVRALLHRPGRGRRPARHVRRPAAPRGQHREPVWLHAPIRGPARPSTRNTRSGARRDRLPVRPVRAPGAGQRRGDRGVLPRQLRRRLPAVHEGRRQRQGRAPRVRIPKPQAAGPSHFTKFLVAPDGTTVKRYGPVDDAGSHPSRHRGRPEPITPSGRGAWRSGSGRDPPAAP